MVANEQAAKEGTQPKDSKENDGARNQSSSTPLLDGANQAAERLERATAAAKAENDRRELLEAGRRLGGVTEISHNQIPKEETPAEYKKRIDEMIRTGKVK